MACFDAFSLFKLCFCLLVHLVIFFLIAEPEVLANRHCCEQTFSDVVLRWGRKGTFVSPTIRSQPSGEPALPRLWTSKVFLRFFTPIYVTGWLDWAGIGLSLHQLGFDNTPASSALGNQFPLRAAMLRTECSGMFQNGLFSLPLLKACRGFCLVFTVVTW